MKLKLEYLHPYLPYKLKMKVGITSIATVTMALTDSEHIAIEYALENKSYKPILRPLSDLILEEFKMENWRKQAILFLDETANLPFNSRREHIGQIIYSDILFLFENHFDLFGLIPLELAIDINTLKNNCYE